jgi:hypothetical protein
MKTNSGPHLQQSNIDASNTGPTSPGDGSLALSMGSTPTQAFAPAQPKEASRPNDYFGRRLRLARPKSPSPAAHQRPPPPPDAGRNMAWAAPRRPGCGGVAGRVDLCCQAMMRSFPAWEADYPSVPSSKYQTVARDRRILRV